MPAGVTWGVYLSTLTVSLLAMLAGAQTVHFVYRPLEVWAWLPHSNNQSPGK
ncbi:hypothetical protein DPMN_016937 [Dreissena polymorpha]|uniref:Uncharacterized protein n=1 Tax=Dreissena polymorpha TaxID=45954 RepID=A0A9D4NAJ8_DREPO|nr:hypothetical protein DPMN_016937 [Dreissena polymorpha]